MTDKRSWFDNEKFWLAILLVLAAAVRIFFLLKYENMPGDAVGNVTGALHVLENPSFVSNFNGGTSILYRYAIAFSMYLWRDPLLAPRVFTVLFGIFLVVPYYGTLKVLFGRAVAFFSTLILVFYPLHVIQSSVTTSDAVYYFFLFGSFYYLFSYKNDREKFLSLVLSALSFNIASLLRFESWIFIPIFFFLLWPKGKKPSFLFLVFSAILPCIWLLLNQLLHHACLYSFNATAITGQASIAAGRFSYDPRWWSWLAILWKGSGPSLVIGGLLGIALAFLTRQKRQLAIFFLALWLAFTVNTLSARMVGNNRYSIVLALLLIPYALFFVDRVLSFLRIRWTVFFILWLIFSAVGFVQRTRKLTPDTSGMFTLTPPSIINIAAWLKSNVGVNETLILEADPYDVFPANILIRSGISTERCLIVYTPISQGWFSQDKGEFQKYIFDHAPDYLVLNSEGPLRKILDFNLSQKTQRLGAISFEAVFEQEVSGYGQFIIYKSSRSTMGSVG